MDADPTWAVRSASTREVIRAWLTGFFPIAFLTYVLTEPLEQWFGTGNTQTAFVVPVVEEVTKVLPLALWATIGRRKHRHGTLSDFLVLGFAIGAGFSFHEDALYSRVVASGFQDGVIGNAFPIILVGEQYTVTHAGWSAIAAVGIGLMAIYRTRIWAWLIGLTLVGLAIADHAAVNWRGDDTLRSLVFDGRLGAITLAFAVIAAVLHDGFLLGWASRRDRLFPPAGPLAELNTLNSSTLLPIVDGIVGVQRYRRLRAAVFCDLYRVRSRGRSAGDRSEAIRELDTLASAARLPTPSARRS